MAEMLTDLRNIRTRLLRPSAAEKGTVPRPPGIEERLAAHERRIHNHPCPCGSEKRYADCCISKINQAQIELRYRRRLARVATEAKELL